MVKIIRTNQSATSLADWAWNKKVKLTFRAHLNHFVAQPKYIAAA